MNALIHQIKTMANEELDRANQHNPLFTDENHAWGVIDEELWEVDQEYKLMQIYSDMVRMSLYQSSPYSATMKYLSETKKHAILAAAELIQVAAMCDKAQMSLE